MRRGTGRIQKSRPDPIFSYYRRRFNKWPVAGAEQAVRACYREFLDEKLGRVIQISSEEQSCEVKET